MAESNSTLPPIVSAEEWRAALNDHLANEKALTKARDALSAQRRRLPMVKVEKAYTFTGSDGAATFQELFEERRQLIVYHFMYGPNWSAGCEGCSWVADAMTHPAHLQARDTSLVMVSRASLEKIQQYKRRMDWNDAIPWYSSHGSDFNYDFEASDEDGENHGVSVFLRDGDDIYRTYHSGARGVEYLGSHWSYLDITPFGRQESWEDSPIGCPQSAPYTWIHRHDEYEQE